MKCWKENSNRKLTSWDFLYWGLALVLLSAAGISINVGSAVSLPNGKSNFVAEY